MLSTSLLADSWSRAVACYLTALDVVRLLPSSFPLNTLYAQSHWDLVIARPAGVNRKGITWSEPGLDKDLGTFTLETKACRSSDEDSCAKVSAASNHRG